MTSPLPRQLFLLGMLVWLAITLPSLAVYPYPYSDDAWVAAPAENFRRAGNFGMPLFPDVDGSSQNYPHNGRLYSLALALIFQVAGFGVVQGRALSVAGALVGASVTFAVGRRMYGRWAGLLAGLLYLWCWRMLFSGHVLRPDAWVAAGGMLLVYAYLHLRHRPPGWSFAALGLGATLLVDVYTSGVFFTLMLSAALVWDALPDLLRHDTRRAAFIRLALFGVGATVGTGWWLAVHLPPDPHLALLQFRRIAGALSSDIIWPVQVLQTLGGYLLNGFVRFTRLGVVELAYALAGLGFLLVRRRPADWLWLRLTGLFVFAYAGTFAFVGLYHLILWMPFLSVAIAAMAVGLGGWLQQRVRRLPALTPTLWAAGLVAPLLGLYLLGVGYLSFGSLRVDYFGYATDLQALVPPGASVMGESAWYFVLNAATYTDEVYLDYSARTDKSPEAVAALVAEVVAARGVEYLLVDGDFSHMYRVPGGEVFAAALSAYADAKCVLLGTVTGVAYGLEQGGPTERVTRVYRCGG